MKIRFSEHIDESHRRGILEEVEETFGGIAKLIADDDYRISDVEPTRRIYLIDFLRQEARRGTVAFDEND